MRPGSAYLLCATPRTGSTLLCSLLSSTGVLGRPESYFREPDEATWARRLAVPVSERERARNFGDFVAAVRAAATTSNGVFGARIMWGTLERITNGLRDLPGEPDLAVLEATLGSLTFVFLRRENVVDQAVSWSRAEQTGYWQQGDTSVGSPQQDLDQLLHFVDTIREHNAAWQAWFAQQQVRPHVVTYEELLIDPRAAVRAIAARLDVALPADWRPSSPHRRQADKLNRSWAAALQEALETRRRIANS